MTDITKRRPAKVKVNPPTKSKINAAAAIAAVSSLLVLFVGPEAGWSGEEQAKILVGFNLVSNTVIGVFRTWFTSPD